MKMIRSTRMTIAAALAATAAPVTCHTAPHASHMTPRRQRPGFGPNYYHDMDSKVGASATYMIQTQKLDDKTGKAVKVNVPGKSGLLDVTGYRVTYNEKGRPTASLVFNRDATPITRHREGDAEINGRTNLQSGGNVVSTFGGSAKMGPSAASATF